MNEIEPLDIAGADRHLFAPHIESEFTVGIEGSEEVISFSLLEVLDYPDHRPEDKKTGRAPFSLVFGCKTHMLEQGTYCLNHDVLAPLIIFISPFENYEQGCKLEAVFS